MQGSLVLTVPTLVENLRGRYSTFHDVQLVLLIARECVHVVIRISVNLRRLAMRQSPITCRESLVISGDNLTSHEACSKVRVGCPTVPSVEVLTPLVVKRSSENNVEEHACIFSDHLVGPSLTGTSVKGLWRATCHLRHACSIWSAEVSFAIAPNIRSRKFRHTFGQRTEYAFNRGLVQLVSMGCQVGSHPTKFPRTSYVETALILCCLKRSR